MSITNQLEQERQRLAATCALIIRDGAEVRFEQKQTKGEFDPDKGWIRGHVTVCLISWNKPISGGVPASISVTSRDELIKLAADATEADIKDLIKRWAYQPPVFGGIGAFNKTPPCERSHWIVDKPLSRQETEAVISKVGNLPDGVFLRDPKVTGILAGRWFQVSDWDWWFFQDRTVIKQGVNAFKRCSVCHAEITQCDRGPKLAPLPCQECGHL